MSESGPPVRRSSLRPAPADYKPSTRDPSTMRPMAVVRAGDSAPTQLETLRSEIPHSDSQHPETHPHLELSEGSDGNSSADRITPLSIPPPPAMPNDLTLHGSAGGTFHAQARQALGLSTNEVTESNNVESATSKREGSPSSTVRGFRSIPALVGSNRRKYSTVAVTLAVVCVFAAVLGILRGRDRNGHTSQSVPATTPSVQTPVLDVNDVTQATRTPKSVEKAAVAVPSTSGSVEHHQSGPAVNSTRVTLELMPIDARVYSHGQEIPGPPYAFDVPKGKKLAIEVKRSGYATAKVVIDGKKPLVHFGMLKEGRQNR